VGQLINLGGVEVKIGLRVAINKMIIIKMIIILKQLPYHQKTLSKPLKTSKTN